MLTPQHPLDLAAELVIDLFAGGGGASTGIEQALGYPPHVAINHDPEAVALHQANHPQTRHFVSDVFDVDPLAVTAGRAVGLLWASPDCKHFSKAKGGKPVSKKIRSLAWVVVKWAKAVRPRVICLENVEEFATWGPLGADDRPCPRRKGDTFRRWKRSLAQLGYTIEHRELRACDYGAPTIRKRLFLVARRDGAPIAWPEPTHGAPGSLPVKTRKLKPWRTAAECIDWAQPCPSIFERARPLADATLRRIAKGVMRYVVEAREPFIVPLTHQGGDRVEPVSEPFKTITGAHRGEKALCVPTIISMGHGERAGQAPRVPGAEQPLGTITAQGRHHALVSSFLAKHYTGVVGSDLGAPIGSITAIDHHSLVAANLVGVGARAGQSRPRGMAEPVATITAKADTALVTSRIVKLRGSSDVYNSVAPSGDSGEQLAASKPPGTVENRARAGRALSEMPGSTALSAPHEKAPPHTADAGGHHAEVRAFLTAYYGSDQDARLADPLHTVTTRDRFGLVTVRGQPYAIVDIGLRMLAPRELYRAQGFPDSYLIDRGADGRALTKTAQVRMCGNSVCPPLARAIVAANYSEPQQLREAA